MSDALFQIIVYPIKLIIEFVYMFFARVFRENPGMAIGGVSLAVSILCLPLYSMAEKLQQKERAIQDIMAARIASIKSHFRGDEKQMILATYYRQNGYHPLMALRSSLGLLVQIPFFIAAYTFISHLTVLNGQSFYIIPNLGEPDGLLTIGSHTINVLPVLMTAINIVSGVIYSRGHRPREKIQLHLMAVFFLFILYRSPSALVIYWTLNNIFSLAKNIVFKLKKPARFLYIFMSVLSILLTVFVVFFRHNSRSFKLRNNLIMLCGTALILCLPLILTGLKKAYRFFFRGLNADKAKRTRIFLLSCISCWVLFGILIPFNLVASSPFEFSFIDTYQSPFGLLLFPALQAAGLFLFWPVYIFLTFPEKTRNILTLAFLTLLVCSLITTFGFPISSGSVSRTLKFENGGLFAIPNYRLLTYALVLLSSVALIAVGIKFKKNAAIISLLTVFLITGTGLSAYQGITIQRGFIRYAEIKKTDTSTNDGNKPIFNLSKNHKNVFIIMLDKAVSPYVPLIFENRPDIKSAFQGFVYYPNTLSYGHKTILGAPALFGGYEYTPVMMNARSSQKMVDKHNEALLVMPTLFKENGFKSMVTDAPFVNYDWVADTSLFTERGIESRNILGNYSSRYQQEKMPTLTSYGPAQLLKRNLLLFSVLSSSPAPLRSTIYNGGLYWNASALTINTTSLDSYAPLYYLDQITGTTAEQNTFTLMVNDLTHEKTLLQYPDYTFEAKIDNPGPNPVGDDGFENYHINAASYRLIGKWLDYLRKEGVYDNTRIIIVSDHGDRIGMPGMTEFQHKTMSWYNPVLLVKDFNDREAFRADNTFMTNADTPSIAAAGLVKELKNPFTEKSLFAEDKTTGVVIVKETTLHQGLALDLLKATSCYKSGAKAFRVMDNIFDEKNWKSETVE